MKEIIALLTLFGSGIGIGLIFGAVIEAWRLHHDPDPLSCENCVHGDLEWDEEPCDTCHDHCAWEAINESEN